ncbi:MAG: metallophosphoesterase family protein [Pseudomonadota bacterium]
MADVHGNADALKAVLTDIKIEGVDHIINLGDHFSGPLDAHGTGELLLESNMISICGNHDRLLLEQAVDEMGPSDRVAALQLNKYHSEWLEALPASLTIDKDIYACHGTPENDLTYWMETVRSDGSTGMADKEHIEANAGDIDAGLLLCGRTHIPRVVRLTDDRLLLNPGSVGCQAYDDTTPVYHIMQTGIPDAFYAIAHRHQNQWSVTIKHVPYDSSRMVAMAQKNNRPGWASAVATGWL